MEWGTATSLAAGGVDWNGHKMEWTGMDTSTYFLMC